MSTSKRPHAPSLAVRSFAKVNLGLKLLGRRADGFHELRTVFQTIDLHDRLTFAPRRDRRLVLTCTDPRVPLNSKNLVVRAARALLAAAKLRIGLNITLEKRIPLGAGLGGGSSNAAATLLALNRLLGLKLPPGQLLELARRLGADVPFFLIGGRVLGIGRGDELFPLPDMKPRALLLASPAFSISTPEAYWKASLRLTKKQPANNMARFGLGVFEKERAFKLFENEFEGVLFPEYPELRRLKRALLAAGAQRAQMTGSGSTVFGMFASLPEAQRAGRKLRWHQSTSTLLTFVVRSLPRSQYLKRVFAASK